MTEIAKEQTAQPTLPARPQKIEPALEVLGEETRKADALLEAMRYLQQYRDKAFVIKYGGSFMDSDDATVRHSVARCVVFFELAQINPIIVHGGGKAITRALDQAKIQSEFIEGERVTSQAAVNVVEQVLSKEINSEIVGTIRSFGGKAQGFSGADIFKCEKRRKIGKNGQPIDLGYVGEIVDMNRGPIWECISKNIIPVISPTARGQDGLVYNCNADLAAAFAARSLQPERLIFMSDVPGVMRDLNDTATLIHEINIADVEQLRQQGVINGGMLPKVQAACDAVRSGVKAVSFIDGRLPNALLLEIFTKRGVGTMFVPSK